MKLFTVTNHHRSVAVYQPGSTSIAQVDQELKARDELLSILKRNLVQAQNRMKVYYDRRHSERTFEVGDMVFLKLQSHKQQSVHANNFHKLSAKYYGPFEVLERIGTVAYKLKLPASARIHNVFHVSLLKKKIGSNASVSSDLPDISNAETQKWYPAAVLETRMIPRRGEAATQWLIQWLGTSKEEATWEFAKEVQTRFPEFEF